MQERTTRNYDTADNSMSTIIKTGDKGKKKREIVPVDGHVVASSSLYICGRSIYYYYLSCVVNERTVLSCINGSIPIRLPFPILPVIPLICSSCCIVLVSIDMMIVYDPIRNFKAVVILVSVLPPVLPSC